MGYNESTLTILLSVLVLLNDLDVTGYKAKLKPETITRAAENTTHYESEGQRIVFGVR